MNYPRTYNKVDILCFTQINLFRFSYQSSNKGAARILYGGCSLFSFLSLTLSSLRKMYEVHSVIAASGESIHYEYHIIETAFHL